MTDYEKHAILKDDRQLGPYPDHLLKRVDKPTVAMPGPIERRMRADNAAVRIRNGLYGPEIAEKAAGFIHRYPLGAVISEVRSRIANTPPSEPGKQPGRPPVTLPKLDVPDDPKALSRNLKALGYFLGADAVGVCVAPPTCFFADDAQGNPYVNKYPNAVVFLKRNDRATTMATDGQDMIVDATAQRTYLHLTMISEIVLSYVKMLGFGAESSDLHVNKNQMPPLIIEAGLAEASRIGIALNPFFGADFKSTAILTDAPLLPDKPIDFGLQEYCGRCGICAEHCIGSAISKGAKELYNGYEKWIFDADKCFYSTAVMENGSNCFVCIMMCPWTRPNTAPEDFRSWDGSEEQLIAAVDARAAELRKSGFARNDAPGSKWWLGLADRQPGIEP
ncbi:MAG: hypothetical protein FWG48_01630 [Oscillospiraceae bacterium]|nr:hypothetical protein [Oscillospiraceae bacterium]